MIDLAKEKTQKIGIFGLARTGIAAYLALKNYATLLCYDDSSLTRANFAQKYDSKILIPLEDSQWKNLDYIVLSPSIPTTFPNQHPIVKFAKQHNIPITSDIELLYKARPDAHYITVTGTNGKSTTTALIHHILHHKHYDIGGNIGNAVLNMEQDTTGYVLELSSFQLDISKEFHSNIGIILNITPDHIERHGTFENYIFAKKSLIDRLQNNGVGILSTDNKITREIFQDLKNTHNSKIRLIRISTKKIIDNGVCAKGGKIFDHISGTLKEYDCPHNKSLQGAHNAENIAAAYAACIFAGLQPKEIISKIQTFVGLPHRMQFLGTKLGIDFYNDSKATNVEAASHSIAALENIYWLAGGKAKEGGIGNLTPLFSHIKKAYLFGKAKEFFAQQIANSIPYHICESMDEAFKLAISEAKLDSMPKSILLAPACASYDQFKDFEERGCHFIELYDRM
jgi:UDP-N-acetylmuramoylalanine--D-glutamate ligase